MPQASLAVCIATSGRPVVLGEALRELATQLRRADRVLVCPAKPEDVDAASLGALTYPVTIVDGARGLPSQRNALLRAAGDADIVVFLDDDFLAAPDYLSEVEALFAARPDCVMLTGRPLADGATNRGYTVAEGRALLQAPYPRSDALAPVYNAYGCNMALRWSRLRDTPCLFDESLPLYAWAEDVDFSRQAAAYGMVLKADALVGVHLAWKGGRTSGVQFGYSQIANQVYLSRKGTVTPVGALRKAAENMLANLLGALRNDEPYLDRRGRLIGNLYGLRDLVTGRSSPQRIFDL